MKQAVFYIPPGGAALTFAARALSEKGCVVSQVPGPEVTHVVVGCPYKGTAEELEAVLNQLPTDVAVLGGRLPSIPGAVDLLEDGEYLAENAAITAECALRVILPKLTVRLAGCPVLVLGWGRIGKCLAKLLADNGARVTVSARKQQDRAMLKALGYETAEPAELSSGLAGYRVIFNTVPVLLLDEKQLASCRGDCIKVELASRPGMAGQGIISALGLPGKLAPEASGELIARTVVRLARRKE